jgi:putative transposase
MEAGLGPERHDHPDTGSDYLKRRAPSLWQFDFACKKKWTVRGLVDVHFLVFIHLESRRIWLSPYTENSTGHWIAKQAHNLAIYIEEEKLPYT